MSISIDKLTLLVIIIYTSLDPIQAERGSVTLYIKDIDNTKKVEFCIGNPHKCFNVIISLRESHTWVAHISNTQPSIEKFDHSISKTYRKKYDSVYIDYNDDTHLKVIAFEDMIWFTHNLLGLNMECKTAVESMDYEGIDGILGLLYYNTSSDDYNSLLAQLKNKREIDYKMFTISISNEETNYNQINIGRLPKHIQDDLSNYKVLQAQNDPASPYAWSVLLNTITIQYRDRVLESKPMRNSYHIGFDYNTEYIILPDNDVMHMIWDLNLTFERDCWNKYLQDYKVLMCASEEAFTNIKSIHIVINDWEIIIPKEKSYFFDINTRHYVFILASRAQNKRQMDYSLVMGRVVLRYFQMVFNEENQTIGFYPSKSYINVLNRYNNDTKPILTDNNTDDKVILGKDVQIGFTYKCIIAFCSIITLSGSILIIWVMLKYSQRKSNKNYNKIEHNSMLT